MILPSKFNVKLQKKNSGGGRDLGQEGGSQGGGGGGYQHPTSTLCLCVYVVISKCHVTIDVCQVNE
jgi:hypothetical protein